MDSSTERDDFCLLRKPLPPSESYRFPVACNTVVHSGSTRFSSSVRYGSRCTTASSKFIEPSFAFGYQVPKNTPYRQVKYVHHDGIDIHPLHPKGPPYLPPGKILCQDYGYNTDIMTECKPAQTPEFTLNDFMQKTDQAQSEEELSSTTEITFSRENYLKMTSWFATQKPKQRVMTNWLAEIEAVPPFKRIPGHQLFLEFRTILKELQRENEEDLFEVPSNVLAGGDTEELVALMEKEESTVDTVQQVQSSAWTKDSSSHSILIKSSISRFFCGEGRSQSPFESTDDQPSMNPAEAAILSSTVQGGLQLSLKAHFLSELPDISHMSSSLTYLNLSYNCFEIFPSQIMELPKLQYLRMRGNPIEDISSSIKMLTNLKLFSIPFNLLSELPQGLFELINLRALDVSHNRIVSISRDIARLRNLKKLNVEYNHLVGLPSTILSLSLTQLRADGNYFHPALWKENTRNQPQSLTEICCGAVSQLYNEQELQPYTDILEKHESDFFCDACNDKVFGAGLRIIRTNGQEQVFGIRYLPLIFQVCSPDCLRTLRACHEIMWNNECKLVK